MRVVNVEQIRDEGLALDEPIERSLLAEALEEGRPGVAFHAHGVGALKGTLLKVSGGVLMKGRVSAPLTAPCQRCLTEVTLDVPVSFTLNLVRTGAKTGEGQDEDEESGGEPAGSFGLEDADQEPFNGKTIDLAPIVREQVVLALPMTVLCRDDCRGLCPVCGQDLNVKGCGCEQRMPDPRLAALKDIKIS